MSRRTIRVQRETEAGSGEALHAMVSNLCFILDTMGSHSKILIMEVPDVLRTHRKKEDW